MGTKCVHFITRILTNQSIVCQSFIYKFPIKMRFFFALCFAAIMALASANPYSLGYGYGGYGLSHALPYAKAYAPNYGGYGYSSYTAEYVAAPKVYAAPIVTKAYAAPILATPVLAKGYGHGLY